MIFGQINLNCITNKLNHVHSLLVNNNIDILCVSESWLTPNTPDSYIVLPNYEIARADSPDSVRKHGVVVYVNSKVKFNLIPCNLPNVVVIYLFDFEIYVVNMYRAPSYSSDLNESLMNFLIDFCNDKEVVLQGDLNLPDLHWNDDVVAPPSTGRLDLDFYHTFISVGLEQVVTDSTIFPSGNIIDLFLSTHSERVGSCEVLAPLPGCYHVPIIVSYVFQDLPGTLNDILPDVPDKLWARGRYDIISSILRDIDWGAELGGLHPDLQYQTLLRILKPLICRYVPSSPPGKSERVPWCTNPPRALVREHKNLWSQYKMCRRVHGRHSPVTNSAWLRFLNTSRKVKNFALNAQKSYERSLVDQLKVNPKLFHGYIKHRKVGRPSVGPIRTNEGELTDNPVVMSECFASSFSSVYVRSIPRNDCPHQTFSGTISNLLITPAAVAAYLGDLQPNSTMGDDGLHPRLLKSLSNELSLPLSMIFNSSLHTGILPIEWLISIIVPIYKKSRRFDPLNYRPISLTSVPCKVFERMIVKHITNYLESNDLISPHQFGFRSGHSTTDQLLLTYNDLTKAIDEGRTVDLIFFDFSKAFDTVSHVVLLQKLLSLGVSGELLDWINVFLTNRQMKVKVRNSLSSPRQVFSGVPQGSVLGPLLFIVYINFVVSSLSCKFKIFADDIKLYLAFDSLSPTHEDFSVLQADVDQLVRTSAAWGLKMNSDKCVVIRFAPKSSPLPFSGLSPYKIDDEYIKFVTCHSDLGVCVDRSLKFHEHIRRSVAVVGNLTTNLLSCTVCRDPDFLVDLYTTHVRPKLEYASQVWNTGYLSDSSLLERVQRRWTRSIQGFEDLQYPERLRRLDLFSFSGRLLRSDLILMWKIFHGCSVINPQDLFELSRSTATRGHRYKIFVPRSRLEVRQRFFSVRVINTWNALAPLTVDADSLTTFKRLLRQDLGELLFSFS